MPVGAVLGAAAITGGAVLASSATSSHAVSQASAAQTAGNNAALGEQQREYDTSRADYAPWRQVGQAALGQLAQVHGISIPGVTPEGSSSDPYGGFTASPDYAFRFGEDQRAVTGNMAARGLLTSGALPAGLIQAAGHDASEEFGNWYNRLASLAGVGQSATDATTQAGIATTNARSGIMQNQADQLASSITARGGIGAGTISGLGGIASGLIQSWPTSTPTSYSPVGSYSPETISAMNVGASPTGLISPESLWGSVI